MSDLIDRQAAIDDIWTVSPLAPLDREWIDRWLRQLPPANNSETPNSSDTISRAKAIDALRAMQTYKLFAGDDMLLIDQAGAQTELMMLPPAQPERIKGHWIIRETSSGDTEARCSHCGFTTLVDEPGNGLHMVSDLNFCPNCGAEMEVTT